VKARTAHTIARRKSGRTFESTARIAARTEAFLSGISGLRGINPVCQRLARHAQSTGWVVSDSPRQVEQLLGGRPSDRELPVGGASMSALWVAIRRGRTGGEVVESRQTACHCGHSGTRCTSENTKSAAAPAPAQDLRADARGHLQVAASTVLVRFITGARSSWSIQASADPVVEGGVDRSVPVFFSG